MRRGTTASALAAAVVAMLGALADPAVAGPPSGYAEVAASGAWHVLCPAGPGPCVAASRGGEVLAWVRPPRGGSPGAFHVRVPRPVRPEGGLSVAVDGRQVGRVLRNACDAAGCDFDAVGDADLMGRLSRARTAVEVEYRDGEDKDLRVDLGAAGLGPMMARAAAARR